MFERLRAARGSGRPPPNLLSELSLCPGFHYWELHGDEHSCTHVCLPSAVHWSPAPHSTVASEHFLGHSCLDFSEHGSRGLPLTSVMWRQNAFRAEWISCVDPAVL